MQDLQTTDLSQQQGEAIFGQIAELSAQTFRNIDLSATLVEAAQVLLLKNTFPQDAAEFTPEFVANTLFPKAVTRVFTAYQMDCFRFCLAKTQDPEISEDIAQEALKLLLQSPNKIDCVGAWLMQVTYNLLCKHYEETQKEELMYLKLSLEATAYEKWLMSGDPMELKELSPDVVDLLLKTEEYRQYHELTSFDNLKEYAAAQNITTKVAQKRKEKIYRNLKSLSLRLMGWKDTPAILDNKQYSAMRKFMRELLKELRGDEEPDWLNLLSPEHKEAVKRIRHIMDWNISMTGERKFKLPIFTIFEDGEPFLFTFNITLSDRNSVSIQDCKVNKHIESFKPPENFRIPIDKGRAMLSYEDIMTLLKMYQKTD